VTAVVEGSVRRAGDRVRISAQLINAADGFHMWAERYDRTLQDVFAVQEEIASSITAALRVALSPKEAEALLRDRPEDVRAYDLYLKGRELYSRYSQDSLREALSLFERATKIEPDYALAWAGIADCYGQMIQWGTSDRNEEIGELGLEAARRAVSLNPNLAEAHKAEALVHKMRGEHDLSNASLERAVRANPRYSPAWTNLCVRAFEECDIASAERHIRRSLEIDPQDAFAQNWLGQILIRTYRYEEMFEVVSRVREMTRQPFHMISVYVMMGQFHLVHRDLAAARRVLSEGRAAGVPGANLQMLEAKIALDAGDLDDAGRLFMLAEASPELGPITLSWGVEIALRRGETERALKLAKRPIWQGLREPMARLSRSFHPLLDMEPLAPRVSSRTLVWPAEAPPVEPEIAALFAGVRVESGKPTPTGT